MGVVKMAAVVPVGAEPVAWWVRVGATALGVVGAIAGLVIGLFVYAPTAPFAALEVGLPAAVAGAIVGAVVGTVVRIRRRAGMP